MSIGFPELTWMHHKDCQQQRLAQEKKTVNHSLFFREREKEAVLSLKQNHVTVTAWMASHKWIINVNAIKIVANRPKQC